MCGRTNLNFVCPISFGVASPSPQSLCSCSKAVHNAILWMQHTVVQSPENTTAVVVVLVVVVVDDDDTSLFDVIASHFQHLLLTNMGSCSSTKLVWIAIIIVTEMSQLAAF